MALLEAPRENPFVKKTTMDQETTMAQEGIETPELMPDPITFTDAAVEKVKTLMDEEGHILQQVFRVVGKEIPGGG